MPSDDEHETFELPPGDPGPEYWARQARQLPVINAMQQLIEDEPDRFTGLTANGSAHITLHLRPGSSSRTATGGTAGARPDEISMSRFPKVRIGEYCGDPVPSRRRGVVSEPGALRFRPTREGAGPAALTVRDGGSPSHGCSTLFCRRERHRPRSSYAKLHDLAADDQPEARSRYGLSRPHPPGDRNPRPTTATEVEVEVEVEVAGSLVGPDRSSRAVRNSALPLPREPSRSGRAKRAPAAVICCLARLIRCAMVGSGTRNARAICAMRSPPTARRGALTSACFTPAPARAAWRGAAAPERRRHLPSR